jgi:hypothetical protein
MATRATYQFISEWSGTHTAYIHHDGYPEGAAQYLFKEIDGGDVMIFNINAFIRHNRKAEMTASHEIHGDTEYRYTICESRFKPLKSALILPTNLTLFGTAALLILSKNIVYQGARNDET